MTLGIAIGQGEWIIILVVVLLLFGSTQLPKLARSLGTAQKEFRKGISDADSAEAETDQSQSAGKTTSDTANNTASNTASNTTSGQSS